MKWTKEKIEEVTKLVEEGNNFSDIANIIGINHNSIRVKMGKLKISFKKLNPKAVKLCVECGNTIINDGLKFCSNSCSASYNNKLRIKNLKSCLNCKKDTSNKKFCSHNCESNYNLAQLILLVESGDKTLSSYVYKKYLIYKHGEKCMECGWCEINPVSGKVPIELEHIDGNAENNSLDNLKLLCPNHHSLTPTYKALNKGNGRHTRMIRYNSGKSF